MLHILPLLLPLSFAWASGRFDGALTDSDKGASKPGQAHDVLGTIVIGLSVLQVSGGGLMRWGGVTDGNRW